MGRLRMWRSRGEMHRLERGNVKGCPPPRVALLARLQWLRACCLVLLANARFGASRVLLVSVNANLLARCGPARCVRSPTERNHTKRVVAQPHACAYFGPRSPLSLRWSYVLGGYDNVNFGAMTMCTASSRHRLPLCAHSMSCHHNTCAHGALGSSSRPTQERSRASTRLLDLMRA